MIFFYWMDGAADKGVLRIIQRYFFLFLKENIFCDPSLELSQRDSSNDGSRNIFLWRNMTIIPKLSMAVTPPYLEHWSFRNTSLSRFKIT